jgi:hypothetical protein
MITMAVAAWFHSPPAILIGLAMIVLTWLRGVVLPAKT